MAAITDTTSAAEQNTIRQRYGNQACRFCQHSCGEHNTVVGCRFCWCAGTPAECEPRNEREDMQPVRAEGTYAPGYEPRPTATQPVAPAPLTKTEVRKHLADVRRSLLSASKMLAPIPAWLRESGNHLTSSQRSRVFRAEVRNASQALAKIADYEIEDRS